MWTLVGRMVTRISSAAALLLIIAGIPAGLVTTIGWPLPDHVPSPGEIQAFLTSDLSDTVLLHTLAVALWPMWAVFGASVVIEAVASLRGIRAPRVTLLSPVQGLAAALVAGLTAGVVATAPVASLTSVSDTGSPPHVAAPAVVMSPASAITPATQPTHIAPLQRPVYRIARGDWLWHIADRFLGDPHRYPEIALLNPDLKDRDGRFPNHIEATWRLVLPDDAQDRGPRRHATGTIITPQRSATPTSPTSPSPAPPATVPSNAPAPAPPPHNDGVAALPSPQPSPPATPSTATSPVTPSADAAAPSTSPVPDSAPEHDRAGEDQTPATAAGWIQIAGGFISAGFALGLLYAVAMVWRRRRHAYQPTPITTPVLDDADLTPPLGALTHLRHSLRRGHPPATQHPPKIPTVREYTTAHTKPPPPPVGPTGADLATAPPLPVATGVGLTGPAAPDAARALLVATLTAGSPDDPDAQGQVVIPAATLATLLGVSAVDQAPMGRLTIVASFGDALNIVEEEIIRRSRILTDHDVVNVAALRDHQGFAEPLPQLLLLTDAPAPAWHTRLSTTLRIGAAVEIAAAVLGPWPHGTTITVAPDGTSDNGQRLSVLDTAAAIELLAVLREAHDDTPAPAHQTPPPAQPKPPTSKLNAHTDQTPPNNPKANTSTPVSPTPALPPTGRKVAVRILGTPAILTPNGEPARGLRAKSVELLVYLAVHRRGASLNDIMEAIWPEATMRRAAERLSTCAANLRGVIRAQHTSDNSNTDADRAGKQLEPVVNTGGHYHLDPSIVDIDWWRLLDHYAQVALAPDDQARLTQLEAAIEDIGGGLADGTDYEWLDTDREYTRRHLIQIHAQAASLIVDTDPRRSHELYEAACSLDPLCDDLARHAMRTAATIGDADAIHRRISILRRELEASGIDLDPDTEDLAAHLIRDLHQ